MTEQQPLDIIEMRIEITYTPHPTKGYTATIWDGPDGIDEGSFVCRSLGECFEQIVMWRTLNAQQYYGGTENERN
jgi:hypothetical protein